MTLLVAAVLAAHTDDSHATCYDAAAARYGLPVEVLHAIARVESGGNARALNKNKNGTEDIGVMQVNTAWLPTLARFGITRERLWSACTNIHTGAWILASNVARHGWNWTAIGAYNAASSQKRAIYARKIWKNLNYSMSETQTSNNIATPQHHQRTEYPDVERNESM